MQDIALVCRNRDRKKGDNTVTIHYVNVSVLIKFILPTFENQTSASCKILHLSVKKTETEKRSGHGNNSLRERLRTHKVHIRPFDNQTSASCKILHVSVKKTETERKEETQ